MASLLLKETLQLFHENCAIKLSEAFGVLQVWKTMCVQFGISLDENSFSMD